MANDLPRSRFTSGFAIKRRLARCLGPVLPWALTVCAASALAEPQGQIRYSTPLVGSSFDPVRTKTKVPQLTTFAAVVGPDTQGARECPPVDWRNLTVKPDGRITLSLAVPVDMEPGYRAWLGAMSDTQPSMPNVKMLQQMVVAIEAGLSTLAGPTWKEVGVDYVLRVTPADCIYREHIRHTLPEALQRVRFVALMHDPGFLAPRLQPFNLWQLIETVAHEAVHVQQMHPFDAHSLDRHARGGPLHLGRSLSGLSFDLELRALMVEHCLRQAVLPSDWNGERLAQTWRDRRSEFHEAVLEDRTGRLRRVIFEHQFRAAGDAFVNARDDVALGLLFEQCAMLVQRSDVLGRYDTPLASERLSGRNALATMRAASPAFRFNGRPYGNLALP